MPRRLSALLALCTIGCSGADCPPGWKPLFDADELPLPALAVWGTSDANVWLVGGPVGAADQTTLVRRWDGSAWHDLPVEHAETLWWAWGPPNGTTVWMVGEHGLVLRWNGTALETLPTGVDATLFGVWGSAADDVWLVGGSPGGGPNRPNDLVLHWDGQAFTSMGPAPRGAAFFKVWGAAADDFWVVGEGGTTWHRTGGTWEDHTAEIGTRDALTTVHGCAANEVYAVGGQSVYRFDGRHWAAVPEARPLANANGVFCAPKGVLVVGNGGLKLRWDRGLDHWFDDSSSEPFYADFHAAWIAPEGTEWAVGGNYNAPASTRRIGIAAFYGCPLPK